VGNLLLFILLPTFPQILGTFTLINVSETNLMVQIIREYFVDQGKYFYFILLHLDATICIGAISLLAVGTLFPGYFKDICGIFKVAR